MTHTLSGAPLSLQTASPGACLRRQDIEVVERGPVVALRFLSPPTVDDTTTKDRFVHSNARMRNATGTFSLTPEPTEGVMPYRSWLVQKLHDDSATASTDDQAHTVFRSGCLEPWLDLRASRRIERKNNLEVDEPEEN